MTIFCGTCAEEIRETTTREDIMFNLYDKIIGLTNRVSFDKIKRELIRIYERVGEDKTWTCS